MSSKKPRGRIGRIFLLLAAVAMIVAVMPLAGAAADEAPTITTTVVDLIVDGGTDSTSWVDIGYVEVTDDTFFLDVKYVVDVAPWCLTAVHIDIDTTVTDDDFAKTKKGLPKIGKFEFKDEDLGCATDYTATFDFTDDLGISSADDIVAIAAHADTDANALAGVELALPEEPVWMKYVHPGTGFGDPSYFDISLWYEKPVAGGPAPFITADAWCVDVGHNVTNGWVMMSSSYGGDTGNVDKPENLPYVNWLINQGFVGQDSSVLDPVTSLPTLYTYGDVQKAIWKLVDFTPNSNAGIGAHNDLRVLELYNAALAFGEGFEPGCGEKIAIILTSTTINKQSTIYQTTFLELGVRCGEETAWAGVWDFNTPGVFVEKFVEDASWAGYFLYPNPLPLD